MSPAEQSWIDQTLDRDLPQHLERVRAEKEPTAGWLRNFVADTVVQLVGDFGAHARDQYRRFEEWLNRLADYLDEHDEALEDHEERLATVEAFVEALGAVTQLLPEDADDIAKLAAGAKFLATELITKGEQEPEGEARLADLIALADRVARLAETARVDVEAAEGEDEEQEAEPAPAEPN